MLHRVDVHLTEASFVDSQLPVLLCKCVRVEEEEGEEVLAVCMMMPPVVPHVLHRENSYYSLNDVLSSLIVSNCANLCSSLKYHVHFWDILDEEGRSQDESHTTRGS